jgi:hypothetical protein
MTSETRPEHAVTYTFVETPELLGQPLEPGTPMYEHLRRRLVDYGLLEPNDEPESDTSSA